MIVAAQDPSTPRRIERVGRAIQCQKRSGRQQLQVSVLWLGVDTSGEHAQTLTKPTLFMHGEPGRVQLPIEHQYVLANGDEALSQRSSTSAGA